MSAMTVWSERARAASPLPRYRRWASKAPVWQLWLSRLLIAAVCLALILAVPTDPVGRLMLPESNWVANLVYPIGGYMIMAVGLNIVVGFAGLLDLGYVAFFAIGAYSMAILGTKYGWNFWEVMPVAIGLSMLSGLLLGAPTLRLRGDYLAIVTLGFGEIIRVTVQNLDYTGGPRGVNNIPHPPSVSPDTHPTLAKYLNYNSFLNARPYYYLVVALLVVVVFVAYRLERSRVGRAWAAIREDEDAAELMGVPTLTFKLWAFSIGAALAGSFGVVYASRANSIQPGNFQFILSALILSAVVLGGSGNIVGVLLGAFLVAWLPVRFLDLEKYRTLMFGVALIVVMIFRPEGLLPSRRRRAELHEGQDAMPRVTGVAGPLLEQDEGAPS